MKTFRRETNFPIYKGVSLSTDLNRRIERFKADHDCLSDSHTLRTLLTAGLEALEMQKHEAKERA